MIFEGRPYFHNQVGLFIKPWHIVFDPMEEITTKCNVPKLGLIYLCLKNNNSNNNILKWTQLIINNLKNNEQIHKLVNK